MRTLQIFIDKVNSFLMVAVALGSSDTLVYPLPDSTSMRYVRRVLFEGSEGLMVGHAWQQAYETTVVCGLTPPPCPSLVSADGAPLAAVAQGALGDSWLVSALNMTLLFPEVLKRVIVSDRHGDKGTLAVLANAGKTKYCCNKLCLSGA